jgi:type IV pilus assembly protein PilV
MRARSRGFTLTELLVSLVVLSVGLLGAAAMLLGSLRDQADARRELSAISLLRDMADRIRANPAARQEYARTAAAGADCGASDCDPAARAAADRAWLATAVAQLDADGTADLAFVPAIGALAADRYVIRLRFAGDDASSRDVSLTLLAFAPVAG